MAGFVNPLLKKFSFYAQDKKTFCTSASNNLDKYALHLGYVRSFPSWRIKIVKWDHPSLRSYAALHMY